MSRDKDPELFAELDRVLVAAEVDLSGTVDRRIIHDGRAPSPAGGWVIVHYSLVEDPGSFEVVANMEGRFCAWAVQNFDGEFFQTQGITHQSIL